MSRTPAFYTERATAAFEAGFTTKTAKQDAIDNLNRAYEGLSRIIQDLCLATPREERTKARDDIFWGLPALHVWKPKHSALVLREFPQADETVKQIEALVELRAKIKDAPIVAAPKKEPVITDRTRWQTRGNCQCCGRDQAVLATGLMSKHGYTVDNGWFNGVCSGERFQPLQKDRTQADNIVAGVRREVEQLKETARKLEAGELFPKTARVSHRPKAEPVPFKDAPAWAQRDAVRSAIYQAEARARAGESFADQLEALANEVHGKELRRVPVND